MTSIRDHPVTELARGVLAARRPMTHRPARVRGPLGAPFDPFDPATVADLPAAYRRLHFRPGVHRIGRHTYALASHRDVRAALRAHDVLTSGNGITAVRASLPMMITMDRPRHDSLRRTMIPHFTAARSRAMEAGMRAVIGPAVEKMLACPGSDAVTELAVPLPMTVIAGLLGVPGHDVDRLHRWSDGVVEGFHIGGSMSGAVRATYSLRHTLALHRYLLGEFARLRREPGDDVVSAMLASCDTGDVLDNELFWLAMMLIVAGNETTTNLISSVLLALATDPEAYQRIRADPDLIGPAIEEATRWGSPIQGFYRTAVTDYTVDETTIPAGASVLLLFGAANRDPLVYDDPDRFVLDRRPADHLGFGHGIHFCLGAHLARVEVRLVLEEILDRVAAVELAGPVAWRDNPAIHGPSCLPLRLAAL